MKKKPMMKKAIYPFVIYLIVCGVTAFSYAFEPDFKTPKKDSLSQTKSDTVGNPVIVKDVQKAKSSDFQKEELKNTQNRADEIKTNTPPKEVETGTELKNNQNPADELKINTLPNSVKIDTILINIGNPADSLKRNIVIPDTDYIITGPSIQNDKNKMGSIIGYVWYSFKHDKSEAAPKIQHPFVILGGYDQDVFGESNFRTMYAYISRISTNLNFIDQLRKDYDVILLTYYDVGAPIMLNAEALAHTIQEINKENNNQDGIILIGISMGGLVSRMAFIGMENGFIKNVQSDHKVKVWATIDTPHQGANIPIGLQLLVSKCSVLPGFEQVAKVNNMLNTTSAKEMLLDHVNGRAKEFSPDDLDPMKGDQITQERKAFMDTLRNWGDFPKQIPCTIAFSSGCPEIRRWKQGDILHHSTGPDGQIITWDGNDTEAIHRVIQQPGTSFIPVTNLTENPNLHFTYKEDNPIVILRLDLDFNISDADGYCNFNIFDRTITDGTLFSGPSISSPVFDMSWSLRILPESLTLFVNNPAGSINHNYAPTNPYSLMTGGWLDTPLEIVKSLRNNDIFERNYYQIPALPRYCFVPIWSALDVPEEYLQVYYNWLTKSSEWSKLSRDENGMYYLGKRALDRGYFTYEDFVDYDDILGLKQGGVGQVTDTRLSIGGVVNENGVYEPEVYTIRISNFNWIYYNKMNSRHCEIDSKGIKFLLDRIRECSTTTTDPRKGSYDAYDGGAVHFPDNK